MARGKFGYIEGMKGAREALQQLDAHTQKVIGKRAVNAAADVFVAEIARRAPVSSRPSDPTPGSLKRSVRKRPSRSTKNLARAEVVADDVAAAPNEFGTSKMAAQPFMRPAVDSKREAAAQAVADSVREDVEHGPWVRGRE